MENLTKQLYLYYELRFDYVKGQCNKIFLRDFSNYAGVIVIDNADKRVAGGTNVSHVYRVQ